MRKGGSEGVRGGIRRHARAASRGTRVRRERGAARGIVCRERERTRGARKRKFAELGQREARDAEKSAVGVSLGAGGGRAGR